MKKNRYFLLFAAGLLVCQVKAQDIHFSQYFNAPLTVSPSNTGNYDGDWRVMGIYRSQWKRIDKPFVTNSIGADKNFYVFNQRISGGILIINDKSAGTLNVQKILVSGAYHKELDIHNFHGGLQLGRVSKSIRPSEETYPNQFNRATGLFDPELPSGETQLQESLSYFDINIGGGYHIKLDKFTPFISLALFHVNTPKESFINDNKLKSRKAINIGAMYDVNQNFSVEPGFLLMTTAKANEFLLGSNLHYKLDPNPVSFTSVYAGIHYRDGINRISDAYFLTAGVKYKSYTVGISYDRNISDLSIATDHRGAFEISFIYQALKTRLQKIEIPCDRY